MPVKECVAGGKPGYKWGDQGHCYTYTPNDKASRDRAYEEAANQGQAIHSNQNKDENNESKNKK